MDKQPQTQSAVELAQRQLEDVGSKCRAQVDAIRSNLDGAGAAVELAERRRQALTVPAASGDAKAAHELEQVHRDIATAKQRAEDLKSALKEAEIAAKQAIDTARAELVGAQLLEIDEACVAEAARFDSALAEAVAASERLDEMHEQRLALMTVGSANFRGIEDLRGRTRKLTSIPRSILELTNPLVWPSQYVSLESSERALLGLPPSQTSKAAA